MYEIKIGDVKYEVAGRDVHKVTSYPYSKKVWRDPVKDKKTQDAVLVALRASYEEKAAKVSKMPLKKLREQIIRESKEPFFNGYSAYMHCCYGIKLDVQSNKALRISYEGTGARRFGVADLQKVVKAIDLPNYWHDQLGARRTAS